MSETDAPIPVFYKYLRLYEDCLPDDYPVEAMYQYSQVLFGVRMYPDLERIALMEAIENKNEATMANAILETNAVVEHVRVAGGGRSDRPRPEWIRGKCPDCGDDLVSNCYYVGGRGYLICWECWSSLAQTPTCKYRHVL